MRTDIISDGWGISYPDAISFAFNRNLIRIQGGTDDEVTVTVQRESVSYQDKRETIGGYVQFDISEYLRLFFPVKETELVPSLDIEVHVSLGKGGDFNFIMTCIWGAINIGDTFNSGRKVVWFKNYPQTVSFYSSDNAVQAQSDNEPLKGIDVTPGIVHLDLNSTFPKAQDHATILLMEEYKAIFDYTFDYTFTSITDDLVLNIELSNADCGIFIRWIDRHGFYQYWLFKPGDISYKVSDIGEESEVISTAFLDVYGITRVQGKETHKTIKACAPLVDRDTFKMLLGLLSSPLPSLWDGEEWIPIHISEGTSTQSTSDLQDFEIQIEMPELITQKL